MGSTLRCSPDKGQPTETRRQLGPESRGGGRSWGWLGCTHLLLYYLGHWLLSFLQSFGGWALLQTQKEAPVTQSKCIEVQRIE